MEMVGGPGAADPVRQRQTTAWAARAVRDAEELRQRLAGLADAIAMVLDEHATVHERMAAQDAPAGHGGHLARVRELAAAERAVAQAYRAGAHPTDEVRRTIRG